MLGISVVGLRRLSAPGANAVAILFGLEALSRGVVASVLPLQTVRLLGSDEALSLSVLAGSICSICLVLAAPWIAGRIGRARMATLAACLALAAVALFIVQIPAGQVAGFVCRASAVALLSVSLNMFIMDRIKRGDLGRSEPLRMLAIGVGWMVGPFLGVLIEGWFGPAAPFLASAAAMLTLIICFWSLRAGTAGVVADRAAAARRSFANPLRHLKGFTGQPRLVLAWMISLGRGFFWMTFLLYTPVYTVEIGLGKQTGAALLSLGTAMMMAMPLFGWMARRFGIRRIATVGFLGGAGGCFVAWAFADQPWVGAAGLLLATSAMALNDGYGNALFFRACRPSQRAGMASVFTTYRDSAELVQAGLFAILLAFLPIQTVYLALSIVMLLLFLLSFRIHPRL